VVIGSPVAGRNRKVLERQIGAYMNVLALRTRFNAGWNFKALLELVKQNVTVGLQHQQYPFEQLLHELPVASQSPLFELGFTWQNIEDILDEDVMQPLENVHVSAFEQMGMQVKTACWIHGWERGDRWRFSLSCNQALFSQHTANRMAKDLQALIGIICQNPDKTIDSIAVEVKQANKDHMDSNKIKEKNLERFNRISKQPATVNNTPVVTTSFLEGADKYPLIIKPGSDNLDVISWAAENSNWIMNKVTEHGAVLMRNFHLPAMEDFRLLFNTLVQKPMDYVDQSSPRSAIAENLYTSTDHPADQLINMHNELSYSHKSPLHIAFFCLRPASTGGETPVSNSRMVLSYLTEATRERFLRKGIRYTRNLVEGIGLSWQEVYQTDSRTVVEEYCKDHNIQFEWKGAQHLRISWTRPAIIQHPVTHEWTWFNHGYFFNAANLDRQVLESIGDESNVPFNTYYGDGTPIDIATINEIGTAYEKAKVIFPWEKGDVLLLDNMLTAHGRNPYKGDRSILVGMGTPIG